MNISVIITGATGMVGEGVLHECLQHNSVEHVLVIGRKPCGVSHPKLTEIIHGDFFNLSSIETQLINYNTCFFCLGVSSVGMNETDYYKMTYTLTLNFANTLAKINPNMTFCYISGAGTDSSEKGRLSWARIKGKTENDLLKLPFRQVYNFRPGFLRQTKGLRNAHIFYRYIDWLFPLFRLMIPNYVSSLEELGLAMIHAATLGYDKPVLEVRDILALSKQQAPE
jgi:uncharacterized protein YbjT (DUF2867 family)